MSGRSRDDIARQLREEAALVGGPLADQLEAEAELMEEPEDPAVVEGLFRRLGIERRSEQP